MPVKTALITGSSRGLGLDLAIECSKRGYCTVLTGRDEKQLAAAVQLLQPVSLAAHYFFAGDLTAPDGPGALYEKMKGFNLSPNLIINSLGGSVIGDRRNIPTSTLREAFRLNLEVGIEINNLFYDDLKSASGMVVHIGSTASLHHDAPPGYVISKAALNAYVKNAARSFSTDNITILAVLPGMLDYEGSYARKLSKSDPNRFNETVSKSPFKRLTASVEVARFIGSIIDSGSVMMNGALIQFDGGKE